MKSIMLSIRPRHVANILNGLKTKEIRKFFPKDYRGWVYIYCTKEKKYDDLLINNIDKKIIFLNPSKAFCLDDWNRFEHLKILNGKVVARFYCDNVDMVYDYYLEEICALSCLTKDELLKYAGGTYDKLDDLYDINITKLEIFDKPKEISEFRVFPKVKRIETDEDFYLFTYGKPLTKAPQNYCYIEEELL